MNFLEKAILKLKGQRPVFHSEDDLKFALAILIQQDNPKYDIRLEKPTEISMVYRNGQEVSVRAPIDMIIIDDKGLRIPIELKYKTKKADIVSNEERFILANHGATDIGRYSFRKDVYRVEQQVKEEPQSKVGFVFIITNEPKYFDGNVLKKGNIDKHYSFHQDIILRKKDLGWNYDKVDLEKYKFSEEDSKLKYISQSKTHWTCGKELYFKLDLLNEYKVNWKDYSKFDETNFKYLLLKIENPLKSV